jgi:hypothetical protein
MDIQAKGEEPIMTNRFTFVLSEREVSIILDALDLTIGHDPLDRTGFTRDDFADMSALLAERIAW